MARGRKRKVEEMNYDEILQQKNNELKELEDTISSARKRIKEVKAEIRRTEKDKEYYDLMKKYAEEERKREELAQMIIDSGKSFEEIEAFLSSPSTEETVKSTEE